jgi:hypothetical protein
MVRPYDLKIMTGKSITIMFILGCIDIIAGILLLFITDVNIVRAIGIFLIAKGAWTVFKSMFQW